MPTILLNTSLFAIIMSFSASILAADRTPGGGITGGFVGEGTEFPTVTLQDMVIDRSNWCSISNELVQAWQREWNQNYKGKVNPSCANFFIEQRKIEHCKKRPPAPWKPTISWKGEGRNVSDLSMGIDKFLQEKNCRDCNINLVGFQCLNLNGVDFSEASLKRADFQYAMLNDARFAGSHVDSAVFHAAGMDNANFSNARVKDAVMTSASLSGAEFVGANLENVDLQRADLRNANFQGATLKNVAFVNANVQGANFDGAKMENVTWDGAKGKPREKPPAYEPPETSQPPVIEPRERKRKEKY